MGVEGEAAGDVLTGGIVAATIEGEAGAQARGVGHGACRNCGATLAGAYCTACGQSAHIHRSLLSLGHDILHGVFHFEGKIWRTIPELFLHPGRLTRRYIDGERAKFVSPMALFLFTVFLMFAVFSFTGGALLNSSETVPGVDPSTWKVDPSTWKLDQTAQIESTDRKLETLRGELAAADLTPERRTELERKIADLQSARSVMEALGKGDWSRLAQIDAEQDKQRDELQMNTDLKVGWPTLERKFNEGLKDINNNPKLLIYKLKTNGYKFSWALIPLSIPFLWLLFFWRRDVHLYDHAIFATYSISFMMLLTILASLAAVAGVSSTIWATVLFFAPPIHMYKQLRYTYGLSRFGAFVRLFFLLIFISIVLSLFTVLLVLMGVLS